MYKVRTTEEIGVECVKCGAVTAGMHMCYERPGPVTALNAAAVIGYDKWSRDRGGGGAAPGADASWAGRDRERDRERERERQARAHQMSHVHAAEPDASSLFPAPIRVNGNRDRLSQQLHNKLGDYQLAQALLDDPSKSIGICAEPQSPAPCPPSRRESEFKKPAHAPQNGRVHHRQHMYSKNEATGPTSAPAHRPPNLKINGFQTQIDSSQPPIESILKEMKSLPIPLSGMAATPRKEQEDKFVFNHALNRLVQDNSQSNDLKTPIAKPGFDSRISNSRISLSPDVNKDLGLSESEDEIGGPTTRLEPLRSPIGSGSPSSGSESSDTETETSSGESVTPDAATAQGGGAPAPRSSWSLSNFAPPAAQPAGQPQPYDALAKELRHALADVKGKATSPISDMSDSESSSASPAARRRRAPALSSDDDNHASPRRPSSQPPAAKRGRPPSKAAAKPSEPPKKRGRPRKQRPAPPAPAPPPAAPPAPDSEPETEPAPAHPQALIDTKTQIFRRVFTPKKGDEGGGKGGKGGKGKGGKGKGQVTIIEVTAPETNVDDDSRRRRESAERRSEEAMSRLSPPHQPLPVRLPTDRSPRDRSPRDRATERTSNDRISSERTERISDRVPDRIPSDRGPDRISDRVPDRTASDRISDRIPSERLTNDRTPSDRLVDRIPSDRPRIPSERMTDRMPSERMSNDRTPSERTGNDRIPERPSTDRLPTNDRVSAKMSTSDRLTVDRVKSERHTDRLSMDRLPGDRAPSPRDKAGDRFVRAEADVGPATEASSNVSSRRRRAAPDRRPRLMVRLPLARLSAAARRALREPAPASAPRRLPALPLLPALPHLPHLPLMPQQIAMADVADRRSNQAPERTGQWSLF